MTSKEALEILKNRASVDVENIPLSFNDIGKSFNKEIKEYYDIIKKDLERLEQIDNANPSEALEKTILLASELGTSKDIKFAETRFPKMISTIKQALLKAQKQDKILDILRPYFSGAIFPSAINFNFSVEDWKPIEEWLNNGKD